MREIEKIRLKIRLYDTYGITLEYYESLYKSTKG